MEQPKTIDQVTRDSILESLNNELVRYGIKIEKTQVDGEIPSFDNVDWDLLSSVGGNLSKNLRRNCLDFVAFLKDYYLIDSFGTDNQKRLEVRDEILPQIKQKLGGEAEEFLRNIYFRSKARNNVLMSIKSSMEQCIRIISGNPKYGEVVGDKLTKYVEQISGENHPQEYTGQERIAKIKELDKVLYNFLMEINNLTQTS